MYCLIEEHPLKATIASSTEMSFDGSKTVQQALFTASMTGLTFCSRSKLGSVRNSNVELSTKCRNLDMSRKRSLLILLAMGA